MSAAAITHLRELSPVQLPDALWREVAARYQEPQRHYHTLAHIVDVAEHFVRVGREVSWRDPASVFCAVLLHDVVYDPMSHDNEHMSALLSRQLLADVSGVDVDRVVRLIALTATHGKESGDALDDDAKLFLDCDMAILGGAPAQFAQYQRDVAAEFVPFIGEDAYAAGRQAFLQRLMASPRIFLSTTFAATHEATARANIAAALK